MKRARTKYKQIVNYVLNGINDGTLEKGEWLPSVNEFRMMFNVSRETVFAGLSELKAKGLVQSCAGKGNYVTGLSARVEKNIFILFNEMNAFKQRLFNAFVGGLKEDDLQRMPMIGRVGIKFLRKIGVFKTEEKQEA